MKQIDVWYGIGGSSLRFDGILIEEFGRIANVKITDTRFLEMIGWELKDGDYTYECKHLPDNYYVRYDDFCWSPKGFVPSEDMDVRESGEEELWNKRKCQR